MNTKQAKDFMADQAAQQAALERTPLSDLERRMMYFTESDPASCNDPISLNEQFEQKCDTAEYEEKMSRLLSHAYNRLKDENVGGTVQWDEAISTLEHGDHYILALLKVHSKLAPRVLGRTQLALRTKARSHGFQELLKPRRFGVNGRKRVGAAVSRFVLRKPRSKRCREVAPKRI